MLYPVELRALKHFGLTIFSKNNLLLRATCPPKAENLRPSRFDRDAMHQNNNETSHFLKNVLFVGAAVRQRRRNLRPSRFDRDAMYRNNSEISHFLKNVLFVGAAGFEPATSCSQSRRDEPGYATPRIPLDK